MLMAHKIALKPNNVQATHLADASGTARFAYNWALAEWQRQHEAWKADNRLPKPSQMALRRQLNAFKHFFAGWARYPSFRRKGVYDRFALTNVRGMRGDRHLARSIADMGFFEFRRQLQYKADMRGAMVVVADRWFASSKRCSGCGHQVETLPSSIRQWTCPACGCDHDRDVNAAINLKHLAVSSTVSACAGEGAVAGRKTGVKPASVKQEVSFDPVCVGPSKSAETVLERGVSVFQRPRKSGAGS